MEPKVSPAPPPPSSKPPADGSLKRAVGLFVNRYNSPLSDEAALKDAALKLGETARGQAGAPYRSPLMMYGQYWHNSASKAVR